MGNKDAFRLFLLHHKGTFYKKKRTKKEQKHMIALTGPNSNTGRNADSVVNDSEHIDVVLHASLELQDSAGSRVAWNPYL